MIAIWEDRQAHSVELNFIILLILASKRLHGLKKKASILLSFRKSILAFYLHVWDLQSLDPGGI